MDPINFGGQPYMPGPGLQSPNIPQIKQGGGMFGGGSNLGSILAAALAGYTSRSNPAPQEALFQSFAQKRQDALTEQRRQQALQDEQSLYDYKQAHAGPDDFTQRVQALEALSPGLGMKYAQTYARNGGGLGLVTDAATGQRYAEPGAVQPPAEAIARLRSNPAEAAQFDEIFGSGASQRALGGQAASPPATFP